MKARTRMNRKKSFIAALLAFIILFSASASFATRVTLNENQQIAFGTMEIPSSGSNTRIVSAAGAGSGTGTYIVGTVQEGQYDVFCTFQCGNGQWSGATFSIINTSIGNCTGMTSIGTFTGTFTDRNGSTSAITFPATIPRASIGSSAGTSRLNIGATATYPSTVSETTSCSPTFSVQITVNP